MRRERAIKGGKEKEFEELKTIKTPLLKIFAPRAVVSTTFESAGELWIKESLKLRFLSPLVEKDYEWLDMIII